MTREEIGKALDQAAESTMRRTLRLTEQYREAGTMGTLRQAIDTPSRRRAKIAWWISRYDARNGAGTGQAFLAQCLVAAASTKTLADVNAELAALEAQAQNVVDDVNGGMSWPEAADAIETALAMTDEEDFSFERLPIPPGYVDVWGNSWE